MAAEKIYGRVLEKAQARPGRTAVKRLPESISVIRSAIFADDNGKDYGRTFLKARVQLKKNSINFPVVIKSNST